MARNTRCSLTPAAHINKPNHAPPNSPKGSRSAKLNADKMQSANARQKPSPKNTHHECASPVRRESLYEYHGPDSPSPYHHPCRHVPSAKPSPAFSVSDIIIRIYESARGSAKTCRFAHWALAILCGSLMLTPCGALCAKRPVLKNSGRQYQNQTSLRSIIWLKLKRQLRKLSLRNQPPKKRLLRKRRSNGKHSLLILPKQPPGFRAAVLFCRFQR